MRHNLSINPHFRKGNKAPQGAGHLWIISTRDSEANLLAWEHVSRHISRAHAKRISKRSHTLLVHTNQLSLIARNFRRIIIVRAVHFCCVFVVFLWLPTRLRRCRCCCCCAPLGYPLEKAAARTVFQNGEIFWPNRRRTDTQRNAPESTHISAG